MDKTLREILAIALDLMTVFETYKADAVDGVSLKEWIALVEQTITILNKHGMSLQQVQEVISEIQGLPFLK